MGIRSNARKGYSTGLLCFTILGFLLSFLFICPDNEASVVRPHGINRVFFAKPPVETRPFIRWWWPGGDVDNDELGRELAEMAKAGFGGAEIQSFGVGLPNTASGEVFTYGSPRWFRHVAFVLGKAKRYGMTIDLTLGSSWPSGGPHIDDAHSLKQLISSSQWIDGPTTLHQFPPPPTEPLYYSLGKLLFELPSTFDPSKMRLAGLMATRYDANQKVEEPSSTSTIPGLPPLPRTIYLEKDSTVDLSPFLLPDGNVHWEVPDGTWILFAFYEWPTGTAPFYSTYRNGGLVLDHFETSAVEKHLKAIVDKGKQYFGNYFGKTLRSLFVDSFELRTELYWTESFLREFYNRRGYRLEPHLPVLFKPFQADAYTRDVYTDVKPSFEIRDIGPRVRQDYELTVSELMIERFIDPVTYWAGKNQLKSRIQAHGGPADPLTAYGHADIPETEGLFAGGKTSFLKLASSAAHLYGKKTVSSEVLDFRNRDYLTTPTDIIREANKHFAAGANRLVLHGFPYLYDDGFLSPGWMPFCSIYLPGWWEIGTYASHLNDRDPFWNFMPKINNYIARAQLVLQSGKPVATIALYTNIASQLDNQSPDPEVTKQLEENGYAFDYVNDEALLRFALVQDQSLRIGDNSYKALVISDVEHLPWDLAAHIFEFAKNGLPIIFAGGIPEKSSGFFAYETREAFIKDTFERMFGASLEKVRASRQFESGSVLFLSKVDDLCDALVGKYQIRPDIVLGEGRGIIHFIHRKVGSSDYYFLRNSNNSPVDVGVAFMDEGRLPEVWDLWTGVITPAAIYSKKKDRTEVALHLEGGGAAVIGFEKDGEVLHVEKSSLSSIKRRENGILTGRAYIPGTYEVWYNNDTQAAIKVGEGLPSLEPLLPSSWELTAIGEDLNGNLVTRTLKLDKLVDWESIPDLKNFSGTGTYSVDVEIDPDYLVPGVGIELDLGKVCDVSLVKVNGKQVGLLLTEPYRFDMTGYLKAGMNRIEVVVTTTLRNRLNGFGATGLAYYKPFQLNPFPALSGLLGPVNIGPYYKVTLDGRTGVGQPLPLPLGLNVVPPNYPDYTEEDVVNAIKKARKMTGNISISWYWRDIKTGEVRDYRKIAPLVNAARSQQLQVTLQFLTFSAFGEPLVPFEQASFGNPEVRKSFLEEVSRLAELQPEYLVLGPELNFIQYFNPYEFEQFISLYQEAYKAIKTVSPGTQVGTSYQYDFIRDTGNWSPIVAVGPRQDFIGFTTYFGANIEKIYNNVFTSPLTVPSDYYAPIREKLGPDAPIVITEVAWSSFLPGGLENQVMFLNIIPSLLQPINPKNVIWALQHDVLYYESFLIGLNYIGLIQRNGMPKPSWNEAIRLKNLGIYEPRFLNN